MRLDAHSGVVRVSWAGIFVGVVPTERPRLRYWFEWGGGCLWAANDAARRRWVSMVDYDDLPLSPAIRRRIEALEKWHDTALDWDNPPGPSPWSPAERARFDRASRELYDQIVAALEGAFDVDYAQS